MEGGEGEIELVNLVSLSLSPYTHTHIWNVNMCTTTALHVSMTH